MSFVGFGRSAILVRDVRSREVRSAEWLVTSDGCGVYVCGVCW